ncbi:hypothetical protein LTR94_036634, partial [Friedmanniomyces endolithicus]
HLHPHARHDPRLARRTDRLRTWPVAGRRRIVRHPHCLGRLHRQMAADWQRVADRGGTLPDPGL